LITDHGESGGVALERDGGHPNRVEQRTVEGWTQRQDHRTATCSRWQFRPLEHRAIEPPQFSAPWLETAGEHDVSNTEFAQGRDGVRREADAEAELTRRRCPFEDPDVPPCLPQGKSGGEATDASADDQGGTTHGE
jgi:hypothetical protein